MIPFLQSLAIELTARHGSELGEFLIVVPHKRGVTYLRRYFEEAVSDRVLRQPRRREMPRIVTIAEHVEEITGLTRGTRLQLLFALYDTHRALFAPGTPPSAESFEDFRRWGETALSDFNDVDMYDVDADMLFRNLSDYNEIRTDFLSEGQRQVIEKYFGVSDPAGHVGRFWKNFRPGSPVQKRFLTLWEKLAPLYHEFRERLLAKKVSYPGLAFKRACELIEGGEYRFKARKVVYAGFNALSTIERRLFKCVRDLEGPDGNLGDFFWDAPGPALAEGSPVDAARFLRRNASDFPCSIPSMSQYTAPTDFPEVVKEISCPGNTAQAKVISVLLEDVIRGHGKPYVDPARVAVVLPDEGLLFPVFHSVPADIADKVNLTMGYPLRLTSVASIVGLLRQMHSRARGGAGACRYYGKDVSALLAHPIARNMTGQELANRISGYMTESHLYFVTLNDLLSVPATGTEDAHEAVRALFAPLPGGDDPARLVEHVCGILELAKQVTTATEGTEEGKALETVHIDRYLEAFREFGTQCADYGIRMSSRTALSMACRLLGTDTVSMQGEPLTGLQIMGMLETRALDFDYLIIPSMNERIFPRKLRGRTFIPDALRLGYGIATTRFQEEIFAYHFYRLIARAKEVYLLYDASQGGLKSGDPSRYLLQLRYLFGDRCPVQRVSARFRLAPTVPCATHEAQKKGAAEKLLESYLTPATGKRLSATSIKDYLACPLKFYFSYVLGKKVDEEPTEFMGAIVIGNVLHETMQYLYDTLSPSVENPATVSAETIRGWLDGTLQVGEFRDIRSVAAHLIRKHYMPSADEATPLPGDALITLDMLEQQVRWCLEADMRLAPFEYLASEWKVPATYRLADGRQVNMTMIIDRLDRVTAPDGGKRLRIVDYKTGSDNTCFRKVSDLFDHKGEHKAIFQLMLYAELLTDNMPSLVRGEPIALSIYKSRQLLCNDYATAVRQGEREVYSHLALSAEFREELDERLSTLFDLQTPFMPPEGMPDTGEFSRQPCRYCAYKALCSG